MMNSVVAMLSVLGIEYSVIRSVGCYPVINYVLPTKVEVQKMQAFYDWLEANMRTKSKLEKHDYYRTVTYFFEDCVVAEAIMIGE